MSTLPKTRAVASDKNHNAVQLQIIGDITRQLSAAGIAHWLIGGWAVDFLVGEITRPHADIDFSIWRTDADAVTDTLVAVGHIHSRGAFPDEGMRFTKAEQHISFTFLERNVQGEIVTPGRYADWPWPAGSLKRRKVNLAGVTCPVINISGLLDAKQNMPFHPYGMPLRDKDRADITLL